MQAFSVCPANASVQICPARSCIGLRLRIWGSVVRISSGAPVISVAYATATVLNGVLLSMAIEVAAASRNIVRIDAAAKRVSGADDDPSAGLHIRAGFRLPTPRPRRVPDGSTKLPLGCPPARHASEPVDGLQDSARDSARAPTGPSPRMGHGNWSRWRRRQSASSRTRSRCRFYRASWRGSFAAPARRRAKRFISPSRYATGRHLGIRTNIELAGNWERWPRPDSDQPVSYPQALK